MKKILFVFPQWHFNLVEQVKYFSKKYDVSTLNFRKADEIDNFWNINFKKIKMIDLKLKKVIRISKSPFFFPSFIDLWKKLDKTKYDLIVFKNIYCPISLMGFLICRMKGIKFIVSEQKLPVPSTFLSKILFFMIKNIYLKYIIFFKNVKCYSCTKVGYEQLKMYTNKRYYIPFSVTVNEELKTYDHQFSNIINILNISKFQYRKDQKLLIEVLNELQIENPSIKINLILIGGLITDNSYYLELKSLCRNIKLSVEFIQSMKHDELKKVYLKSDLFVLSSYDEPAAYSHLDAMSYGLPVICSDQNGTSNYIHENENGFIFKARDFNSLKSVIEKTIFDEKKSKIRKIDWKKLSYFGKNSVKLVKNNYLPIKIYKKFDKMLIDV